jgi:NTP pyrophosphatase (non-canonical NTP hydrolase)
MSINLEDYQEFALSTASDESKIFGSLIERLYELYNNDICVFIPELLTGAAGLSSEGGEFNEIVKKLVFQGKPLTPEVVYHLKRELGDIAWYFAQACTALNTTIEEVLTMNVEKLSARYPEGFEIIKSEVRKEGDI